MSDASTAVEAREVGAGAPEEAGDPEEAWFRTALDRLGAEDPLQERRRRAWARYRELSMPTTRSEEWRYTDISDLEPADYRPAGGEAVGVESPEELPAPVRETLARSEERAALAVFRNGSRVYGRLDPELAEEGVVFTSLSEAVRDHPELVEEHLFAGDVAEMEEKLWTLHIALLTDGYLLHVPRNVRVEHPVHVFRYVDEPGTLVASHSLIVAGTGAEVTCIDEYLSPDLDEPALSVAGTELVGGENSTVRYVSLQRFGRGMKHFSIQHVEARRDARLSGFNATLGGDLSRADVTSHLTGPGSESEMLALWFGDGEQHFDHHTLQNHVAPHAHSDLLYKGALADRGRSVFRGLIRVMPGAQLTDAYQTNRNLLLSERANATALPNLEIEADDVRCSHGATIGQVDETQLFYLMSRGLTRLQAERLLVLGFFDEVLRRSPVAGVRERVREAIEEKIGL